MTSPEQILFLSLLFAHLLADFGLQSAKDIRDKAKPAVFAKHIAWVTVLAWVFSGDWFNPWIPLIIGTSHAAFDALKTAATAAGYNAKRLFFIDQAAHIAVLAGVAWWAASPGHAHFWVEAAGPLYIDAVILGCGFLLAVFTGGILIGMATEGFTRQIREETDTRKTTGDTSARREGLAQGGRIIGWLERALIFFFVLIGKPEAVAFLVAAKSVFRFGELTKDSRKEAEYILIGTLMSFGWAIPVAWFTRYLLNG
ncbi:MAG: DUF3307 domain-containing protein [Opitutales bacterium]|nr:DUF3307 domain-containing protein [Opitutales bacterium]